MNTLINKLRNKPLWSVVGRLYVLASVFVVPFMELPHIFGWAALGAAIAFLWWKSPEPLTTSRLVVRQREDREAR